MKTAAIISEYNPFHNGHKYQIEKARELLENAWGVEVIDDVENFEFPTALMAAGTNPVYVGRIRKDIAFDNAISFWCVADNLRIGAALNTVRIAEKVIEMQVF